VRNGIVDFVSPRTSAGWSPRTSPPSTSRLLLCRSFPSCTLFHPFSFSLPPTSPVPSLVLPHPLAFKAPVACALSGRSWPCPFSFIPLLQVFPCPAGSLPELIRVPSRASVTWDYCHDCLQRSREPSTAKMSQPPDIAPLCCRCHSHTPRPE
jgi:hypothetical protein